MVSLRVVNRGKITDTSRRSTEEVSVLLSCRSIEYMLIHVFTDWTAAVYILNPFLIKILLIPV